MIIYELSKPDFYNNKIEDGRNIFMNYFLDLYKDKTSQALQIKLETKEYLTDIFNRTIQDLKRGNLYSILAYSDNKPIGFCSFGTLEDKNSVLIRTLPIDNDYKKIELEWRKKCLDYVRKKFPSARQIIIMVRKANEHHQLLCEESGFCKDDSVFNNSSYINSTYDIQCYYGYSYFFND